MLVITAFVLSTSLNVIENALEFVVVVIELNETAGASLAFVVKKLDSRVFTWTPSPSFKSYVYVTINLYVLLLDNSVNARFAKSEGFEIVLIDVNKSLLLYKSIAVTFAWVLLRSIKEMLNEAVVSSNVTSPIVTDGSPSWIVVIVLEDIMLASCSPFPSFKSYEYVAAT